MDIETPWGKSQTIDLVAEGILIVTTASHGGILLSPDRAAAMPGYMKRPLFAELFAPYEEDCDWCMPVLIFEAEFRAYYAAQSINADDAIRDAQTTFRHWHPDAYETFHGVTLKPGESYIRDKQRFYAENKEPCSRSPPMATGTVSQKEWWPSPHAPEGERTKTILPPDIFSFQKTNTRRQAVFHSSSIRTNIKKSRPSHNRSHGTVSPAIGPFHLHPKASRHTTSSSVLRSSRTPTLPSSDWTLPAGAFADTSAPTLIRCRADPSP